MKMPKFILLLLLSGIHLLAAVEGSAQTEQAQRITREFKVDVAKLTLEFQKMRAQSLNGPSALQKQLEQLFAAAGMVSPIQMELDAKAGILRVTAPPAELALIPPALEMMDTDRVQVRLEVKHIEMPPLLSKQDEYKVFFEKLPPADVVPWQEGRLNVQNFSATNVMVEGLFRPNHVQVLSEAQFKTLFHAWEQHDEIDLLALPYGFGTTNQIIYVGAVQDFAKGTVTLPSYYGEAARIENLAEGYGLVGIVEGRVSMQPDRKTITLDWIARITQVLDHRPTSKLCIYHVTGSAQMKDGETLLVGCGTIEQVTKDKNGVSHTNKFADILTLTPRLLGLNGEPINK